MWYSPSNLVPMTATMGSRYCKSLTSYSVYAPFPDEIEVIIQAPYTAATQALVLISSDYYSTISQTVSLTSRKATAGITVSNPQDYTLHTFTMTVQYYDSDWTFLGSETGVNVYKTSSTEYHMQGIMGEVKIAEESRVTKPYPEIVSRDNSEDWTVEWKLGPLESSTYPGSVPLIKAYFKYSSMDYQEITATVAGTSSYLSRWNHSDNLYQAAFGIAGKYSLKIAFSYYTGDRYSSLQYIVRTTECTLTIPVYEVATPSFEISSVVPTLYSLDSEDPLEGKAPYAVTWHDTTSENHPYAVPQKTILWCFGDSSSNANYVQQNNSSGKIIVAQDQTHAYPDYARYTVTMQVTDYNGNVRTGTNSFQGSTKLRQFAKAALSMTGTYAPVLLAGTADVTGSPMPEPTWTYTLDGEGSYSGSVTGTYVEMSLLKEGVYKIVYQVTLDTVVKTTTWDITVKARSVIEDDSQDMQDFALVVLNNSLKPVNFCRQHSSVQYIENYQDLDTFSFEISSNYVFAKYLQEGDLLLLGYLGKARLMQVTYRERDGGTLIISGESAFPERIALTATKSSANDGRDTQTCTAEALIRYFVISCLKDSYGSEPRSAAFAVFGADEGRGGVVTYSARFEKLRDIVKEICQSSNLGFTLTGRPTVGYAGMTIREGVDRTYTSGGSGMVIFSPERLKNCVIESDTSSLSHNVAIGAGNGSGASRVYSYYGETTKTGFYRREMFTDAGDSASDSEVERMAGIALKEDKQLSIRIQVLPVCQWTFGVDYNVGDVVTLESPDRGSLDLQIYAAESCRRSTGDELYLDLGYECATAPSLIRRVEKGNGYARK